MFDTLTVSRTLTETGLTPAQADAITHAVKEAAEHGDPITRADLTTAISGLRTDLTTAVAELNTRSAELEVRLVKQITAANLSLVKWMVGAVLAGAGLTIAVLQFLA